MFETDNTCSCVRLFLLFIHSHPVARIYSELTMDTPTNLIVCATLQGKMEVLICGSSFCLLGILLRLYMHDARLQLGSPDSWVSQRWDGGITTIGGKG